MPFPWPSFGGFLFIKGEHEVHKTDIGWAKVPNYTRAKPLGTSSDVITAMSIGSSERSFEVILTPERFRDLEFLLNTTAVFTDWARPAPDSRLAFLSEVSPIEDVLSFSSMGSGIRKIRTRVALLSV